jgi:ubiquinone/menaquinone biosynthesis C-methylase UbiE
MNHDKLKKYLYWDFNTWGVGLQYILSKLPNSKLKALELGANQGGISVCLVNEKGFNVVCSDLDNPLERVLTIHPEMKDNTTLSFDAVNGLENKYADNSFDVVVFKSVLGYINSKEKQQQFINEIYRVLKPGGYFCFLENAKASALHRFARKNFISWGKDWRYITPTEMNEYLSPFKNNEIKTCGFLTAFAKGDALKSAAFLLDKIVSPLVGRSHRYVVYGIATK